MIELNRRYDRNGGNGGSVAIAADHHLETIIVRA
jgi:GTPase involved in cell partitioning and DNA repair